MPLDPTARARIEAANMRILAQQRNVKQIVNLDPSWMSSNIFKPNNETRNLVIRGMRGLGDNINQRAFLKELNFPFYLDTPWPELYIDLPNIRFIPCQTPLRTQNKNLARQPATRFVEPPEKDYWELRVQYGSRDLQVGSMYQALSKIFGGVKPRSFDIPPFPFPKRIERHRKMAVIRPATVRKEWAAVSRNPDPKYIKEASQILLEDGYYIISVADVEEGQEWLLEPRPVAQLELHHGELSMEELLGLCRGVNLLVGGHGFLTHISLTTKVPMLCVLGGFGGDNRPASIADPNFLDVSPVSFAVPDSFCMCTRMDHMGCNKTISNFEENFREWLGKVENREL